MGVRIAFLQQQPLSEDVVKLNLLGDLVVGPRVGGAGADGPNRDSRRRLQIRVRNDVPPLLHRTHYIECLIQSQDRSPSAWCMVSLKELLSSDLSPGFCDQRPDAGRRV